MPTAPLISDDGGGVNRSGSLDRPEATSGHRATVDPAVQAALGLYELPIVLIDLDDFTVRSASGAALRRLGLSGKGVVGRPITEIVRVSDREAARLALEALRNGIIDFYRAQRSLVDSDSEGRAFTAWARTVEFGEDRFALVEMAFDDDAERGYEDGDAIEVRDEVATERRSEYRSGMRQSPLASILGRDPPAMAIGVADRSWVITCISRDIVKLLGVPADAVIGTKLLSAVDQQDVQRLLDAARLMTEEYSVARSVRMRGRNGEVRRLCCVLTALDTPGDHCFILLPYLSISDSGASDRADALEQHLFRIAAELDASGVLERIGEIPRQSQFPELSELSARQWEVLRRLMRGQRVPTIAAEMYLSQSTVRNHLSAIFERFGVHSQAELLARLSHS